MVRLTVGGSQTSGSSSNQCETKSKTTSTSLVMPGIKLGGQESTEYKVTIFRRKTTDITVQLIKQLRFEDGTSALPYALTLAHLSERRQRTCRRARS